jgi:hypothetical protein
LGLVEKIHESGAGNDARRPEYRRLEFRFQIAIGHDFSIDSSTIGRVARKSIFSKKTFQEPG